MLQQPFRVNVPANITFAGGDVVKERFHMLLPWIKVGSSANYGDRNGTSTCKDVASVFLNNLFDATGRR